MNKLWQIFVREKRASPGKWSRRLFTCGSGRTGRNTRASPHASRSDCRPTAERSWGSFTRHLHTVPAAWIWREPSLSYSCHCVLVPRWPRRGCRRSNMSERDWGGHAAISDPLQLFWRPGFHPQFLRSQLSICLRLPALFLPNQADIIAPQTPARSPLFPP